MDALPLLLELTPVGVLLLAGYAARHLLFKDEAIWRSLERFSFYLLMPVTLIAVLLHSDISQLAFGELSLALLLPFLVAGGVLMLLYRPLRRHGMSNARYSSLFQTGTRWNAMIALALLLSRYGAEGLAYLAIAVLVLVPLINLVNVVMLTLILSQEPVNFRLALRRVAQNPIILGCAIGLLLASAPISLWPPIDRALLSLSDATAPIILLIVGAAIRFDAIQGQIGSVLLASAIRLGLTPLIAFGVARYLGLSDLALMTVVVAAAVPTAANGYILAREMGGDATLYANIASFQTLASAVSLPLWMLLVIYSS